jgi:hypothetical protein
MKQNQSKDEINFKFQEDGTLNKSSSEFIRILTSTVLEVCIDSHKRLHFEELSRLNVILVKFLEGDPEKELQALYAIQRLIVRLEHPQGKSKNVFSFF